jgi:hypothetical protein
MPAARAAEAFVFSKTSEKCSTAPAPLLAMTGIVTASDTILTKSMSNPQPWPARQDATMESMIYKPIKGQIHMKIEANWQTTI